MPEESRSLWEQFDSEVEPWRRRFAIVLILTAIVLGQVTIAAFSLLNGTVEAFVGSLVIGWIGFFLIYLIWIGQNWTRWLIAPFFGLSGFCYVIWGIARGNALLLTLGTLCLIIFAYLAFGLRICTPPTGTYKRVGDPRC
jgi:hypothetical protein